MKNGSFLVGLALGVLTGHVVNRYAHTRQGRQLRRQAHGAVRNLQEGASVWMDRLSDRAACVCDEAVDRAEQIGDTIRDKWEQIRK